MAFVTDNQAPELVDPSKGALDDLSVLAQMLAAFDAAAGNARRDVSRALLQKFVKTQGSDLAGAF